MSSSEASLLGGRKALSATVILYAVPFIILLVRETSGDFANGILFFMQALRNVHVLLITIVLFGLTFLFGRRAGKEIIVDRKNFLTAACKYAFIIALALVICIGIAANIKDDNLANHSLLAQPNSNLISTIAKIGLILFMSLLAVWLWAANSIHTAGAKTSR
jgi:hypothetical protein